MPSVVNFLFTGTFNKCGAIPLIRCGKNEVTVFALIWWSKLVVCFIHLFIPDPLHQAEDRALVLHPDQLVILLA